MLCGCSDYNFYCAKKHSHYANCIRVKEIEKAYMRRRFQR